MGRINSFCVLLTLILSSLNSHCQDPLNEELYLPMPLQAYTAPKDTNDKVNKLIVFNMVEKKFDTIRPDRKTYNLFNRDSRYEDQLEIEKLNGNKNMEYTFSNVQPADQLNGFPDYPVSTIVKLFLNFFNPVNGQMNFATCSGVLIHPGYILTGGHCVKSKFDSSYAVSCTVIPAYNLGKRPFGLTTTTNWYSFSQWTQNGNLDYDIAIMSLSSPIGNTTGWLELGFHPNDSFFTSPLNVFYSFGYPGSDPLGNPVFEEGERMYYMYGNMDFLKQANSICHNNIGYQGQSGSGLFYQDSSNNRMVFGVLSHGNLFPPYHTCHCRMDSFMFKHFNNIIQPVSTAENKNSEKQILLYPNPTKEIFTINFGDISFNKCNVRLFDVNGFQISEKTIYASNSLTTFDLSSFPMGTYIIRAELDGQSIYGRICKTL